MPPETTRLFLRNFITAKNFFVILKLSLQSSCEIGHQQITKLNALFWKWSLKFSYCMMPETSTTFWMPFQMCEIQLTRCHPTDVNFFTKKMVYSIRYSKYRKSVIGSFSLDRLEVHHRSCWTWVHYISMLLWQTIWKIITGTKSTNQEGLIQLLNIFQSFFLKEIIKKTN